MPRKSEIKSEASHEPQDVIPQSNLGMTIFLVEHEISPHCLLTLVATQEPPLTISLNGHWGTMKDFPAQALAKVPGKMMVAKAVADFNAWEECRISVMIRLLSMPRDR